MIIASLLYSIVCSQRTCCDASIRIARATCWPSRKKQVLLEIVDFFVAQQTAEGERRRHPQAGIITEKINSVILVSVYTGPDLDIMKQICDSGYMEQDIKYLRLEAGPILDNDFAQKRCPEVLATWLKEHPDMVAQWDGNWETTIEGEMSICGVKAHPK